MSRLINIPGIYCWGYNDEVCPPTSIYAAYNNIHAQKEKVITKEAGHGLSAEQSKKVNDWLLNFLFHLKRHLKHNRFLYFYCYDENG
jgi:cephalosporin-C deacetylase-like acetyl esterase